MKKISAYTVFLLLIIMACPFSAQAYKVTQTETGAGLYWDRQYLPIPFYLSKDLTSGQMEAIKKSFATWENVPTAYVTYQFQGTLTKDVVDDDGVSFIFFSRDVEGETIAQTSTFYYTQTGQIIEADMELNSRMEWTTSDDKAKLDLQDIATHEIGHMSGLDDQYNSGDYQKTMYYLAIEGETYKRSLSPDDESGISYIYPMSLTGSYSISGKIIEVSDATDAGYGGDQIFVEDEYTAIDGVVVELKGATTERATSENGYFAFHNLKSGNYIITPMSSEYDFIPTNLSVTVSKANVTGLDFEVTEEGAQGSTQDDIESGDSGDSGGGFCFIATYAYGAGDARVARLKAFRDRYLLSNPTGRIFVTLYYRYSPRLTAALGGQPAVKALMRTLLTPVTMLTASSSRLALAGLLLLLLAGVGVCRYDRLRRSE